MENQWDEYAENWDSDSSVQEYAYNAFLALQKYVQTENLSIFDFGCGTGSLTQLLSPSAKNIVALDASEKMIQKLEEKKLNNVVTISDYLSEELLHDNIHLQRKFDVIIASSVCSFLPNYEETLNQLKSLLKPSGVFVQFDWLSEKENSDTGLSAHQVETALKKTSFEDIQITYPFSMKSSGGEMKVIMAVGKNV